eukprot:321413_1
MKNRKRNKLSSLSSTTTHYNDYFWQKTKTKDINCHCTYRNIFVWIMYLIFLFSQLYCIITLSSHIYGVPNKLDLHKLHRLHRRAHLSLISRKIQMGKLLSLWHNVSITYNISYWLDGGTLIGLYRNNDFLDWDKDIDIILTNVEQFCNLTKDKFRNDKHLSNHANIFKSSRLTRNFNKNNMEYLSSTHFNKLNHETDYVLRINCLTNTNGKFISHTIGELTHVFTGLYLEIWNPKIITRWPSKTILNVTKLEQIALPVKRCTLRDDPSIEAFCPNHIENTLKLIYDNDLSPSIYLHYFSTIYLFLWIIIFILDVTFNYKFNTQGNINKAVRSTILQQFIADGIFIFTCLIFCSLSVADDAWCLL